ncbi:related to RRN3 - RNA polymerase I specific transcription factor [Pseudozyma flocculosa]|uniref:Related to RRN3 - RNA polymerase I specific transcription factor n=1 Tax=Pseudozyma flocculosa TaxID=84751 RepID=A0A5C3EV76_9BASI|nr:related to RRN3 - RNA polymerase I specific transcription factor [Pseudozyma flocculosa]
MVTAVPIQHSRPPQPPLPSTKLAANPVKAMRFASVTLPAAAVVRRTSSKRSIDDAANASLGNDATYSPAKRRSPPSDDESDDSDSPTASDASSQDDDDDGDDDEGGKQASSSPLPSSQQRRPIRSALSSRSRAPSGSLAAMTALSPAGDYRQGMYLSFVSNALQEKSQGNLGPYNELAAQFNISAPALRASPAQLKSWMAALSHVVSALDRTHSQLVENILQLPWYLVEDHFAHLWIKFVCSLVSARGEWLNSVLSQAVQGLEYMSNAKARSLLGLPVTEVPEIDRRQLYDRFHLLIRSLMALIPTLPSSLLPLLARRFPPKAARRSEQLVYVRNMLRVATYCAELSESILNTVIDRAIQLDVEIQVELDDLEEDVLGQDLADPFDNAIDDDDGDESDDGSDAGDNLQDLMDDDDESADEDELEERDILDPEDQQALERIRTLVATLDSIMTAVLEHLTRLNRGFQAAIDGGGATGKAGAVVMSAADGEANRRHLFHTLLGIFTRAMLPTFKCRHVQFLLFWFNSLDAEYSDLFLGVLLSKSLYGGIHHQQPSSGGGGNEVEEPDILRSAAASYVASFVSRASYVDGPTSRIVVLNLCAFLDAHLEASQQLDTEIGAAPPGSRVHSVFYAVAQAVFYIFCFRWRDLKLTPGEGEGEGEDDEGDADADELAGGLHGSIGALSQASVAGTWCDGLSVVQRAITSPLNPLKFCSANVVKQFARIAQHTGFLYCYSIIESNNRMGRVATRNSRQPSRTTSLNTLGGLGSGGAGPGGDSSREGSDQHKQLPDPIQTSSNLDVFFPFDPYKLQTSASFVDPLYREWADVAPEEDGDSDDDDDDDDDDGEDDDNEGEGNGSGQEGGVDIPGAVHASQHRGPEGGDDDDEGSAASFVSQVEAMSISPYRG